MWRVLRHPGPSTLAPEGKVLKTLCILSRPESVPARAKSLLPFVKAKGMERTEHDRRAEKGQGAKPKAEQGNPKPKPSQPRSV